VLKKIYNGDNEWIDYEIEEIKLSHEQQERDKAAHGGNFWTGLKKVLKTL